MLEKLKNEVQRLNLFSQSLNRNRSLEIETIWGRKKTGTEHIKGFEGMIRFAKLECDVSELRTQIQLCK